MLLACDFTPAKCETRLISNRDVIRLGVLALNCSVANLVTNFWRVVTFININYYYRIGHWILTFPEFWIGFVGSGTDPIWLLVVVVVVVVFLLLLFVGATHFKKD